MGEAACQHAAHAYPGRSAGRCAASTSAFRSRSSPTSTSPLSRLLNLHVRAARNLNGVTDTFLGRPETGPHLCDRHRGQCRRRQEHFCPILQALMARWPRPSGGEPRDNRRLPLSAAHPGGKAARRRCKGYSRELRCPAHGPVPVRCEGGSGGSTRAGLFASVIRHRARSSAGRASADLRIFEGLNVLQPGLAGGSRWPARIGDPLRFLRFLDLP